MARKAPKCSKGFPCGKTCISRNNNCFANLSTQDSRIAETFSQFVNRIVGIGNNNQSAVKNENPVEVTAAIDKEIKSQERTTEILTDLKPRIEAGEKVTDILNNLRPELQAGRKATELLNNIPVTEVAESVSVEVMEDNVTKIPRLLNPEQNDIDVDAETIIEEIKDEIKSGEKVIEALEAAVVESVEPENASEIIEKINTEIVAGEKANELLRELKPRIEAGEKVTDILNNLKPEIEAGKEVTNILNNLKPEIEAGPEVAKILQELKPQINAGENVTNVLNNLKPESIENKSVEEVVEELKPEIKAAEKVEEALSEIESDQGKTDNRPAKEIFKELDGVYNSKEQEAIIKKVLDSELDSVELARETPMFKGDTNVVEAKLKLKNGTKISIKIDNEKVYAKAGRLRDEKKSKSVYTTVVTIDGQKYYLGAVSKAFQNDFPEDIKPAEMEKMLMRALKKIVADKTKVKGFEEKAANFKKNNEKSPETNTVPANNITPTETPQASKINTNNNVKDGEMGVRLRAQLENNPDYVIALDNGKYLIGGDEYSLDKSDDGSIGLVDSKGNKIPEKLLKVDGNIANVNEKELFEAQFKPKKLTKTGLESDKDYRKLPEYGFMGDRNKKANEFLKGVKNETWKTKDAKNMFGKDYKIVENSKGETYRAELKEDSVSDRSGNKTKTFSFKINDKNGGTLVTGDTIAEFGIPLDEWNALSAKEQEEFINAKWAAIFS